MQNNKPIWFNKKKNVTEIDLSNLGKPGKKIFVATPVHSECSIHFTQSLLVLQQECMQKGHTW
jgi:hypothetical protein